MAIIVYFTIASSETVHELHTTLETKSEDVLPTGATVMSIVFNN